MIMKDKDPKPIVHIATDEKFIDAAYDIYEKAFPEKNLFLILKNDDQREVKYLSKEKDYYFLDLNNDLIKVVEEITESSKVVVFHGINYSQAIIANNLEKNEKSFVWTVFGAEVYNNPLIFGEKAYGDLTNKKFVATPTNYLKDLFRKPFYRIIKKSDDRFTLVVDAFSKMDHVGVLYREEFDYFQQLGIVNPKIEQIRFTYYPLNTIIKKDSDFVNAENILLGNSASYTNNHLEAFEILKKLDLKNNDIITPLSYGNKEYANQIIDIANQKFGERFSPLTDFLPLDEYQKILESCGIVIMNHYRKQAGGNVLNAIYLGAKVYLSTKNILYHYFKRIGCHVFCIEKDLVPGNPTVFDLLTKNQMHENREILTEELSLDRVVNELKEKLTPVLN